MDFGAARSASPCPEQTRCSEGGTAWQRRDNAAIARWSRGCRSGPARSQDAASAGPSPRPGLRRLGRSSAKLAAARGACAPGDQRRNSAIRRIDDHRGPLAGPQDRVEDGVIGAADVLGLTGRAGIASGIQAFLRIRRRHFRVGQEFLAGVCRGAFQRDVRHHEPGALQIGIAPGRPREPAFAAPWTRFDVDFRFWPCDLEACRSLAGHGNRGKRTSATTPATAPSGTRYRRRIE